MRDPFTGFEIIEVGHTPEVAARLDINNRALHNLVNNPDVLQGATLEQARTESRQYSANPMNVPIVKAQQEANYSGNQSHVDRARLEVAEALRIVK